MTDGIIDRDSVGRYNCLKERPIFKSSHFLQFSNPENEFFFLYLTFTMFFFSLDSVFVTPHMVCGMFGAVVVSI